jgi:hypothetical protein
VKKLYEVVEYLEKEKSVNVDIIICAGDFQATR